MINRQSLSFLSNLSRRNNFKVSRSSISYVKVAQSQCPQKQRNNHLAISHTISQSTKLNSVQNRCCFSTLKQSGRLKGSSKFQPAQTQNKANEFSDDLSQSQIDQKVYFKTLIEKRFEEFMAELSGMSEKHFSDYDKLIDLIDRYINQDIFQFHSHHPFQYSFTEEGQSSSQGFVMNPYLLNNYSLVLNLKSSLEYRFRKFDNILTNIENEIYLLHFLKLDSKMDKKVETLCAQYLHVLILHDHDKLRRIMTMDYTKNVNLFEYKAQSEEKKGRKINRRPYKPVSKPGVDENQGDEDMEQEGKRKSVTTLSRAFRSFMMSNDRQVLVTKSLALAVIGQFDKSLKTLSQLISSKRNKQHLSTFLPIYIFYGNENYHSMDPLKYSSVAIKQFVKNCLCKRDKHVQPQSIPQFLSPQDSEYLLNSIISYLHDQPLEWSDLSLKQLESFGYSVYLIAENYYLNNQKQKAVGMINELKNKLMKRGEISLAAQTQPSQQNRPGRRLATKKSPTQQPIQKQTTPQQDAAAYRQQKTNSQLQSSLLHLITFFQLMHSYDSKSYSHITSQQSSFSQHQKQHFYQWYSVKNDTLRSNIYQIFSETFTKLNSKEKADQYASWKVANVCVNDTYEINNFQETISEEEIKMVDFLKQKKQTYESRRKGVPPYYLPIVTPFLVHF